MPSKEGDLAHLSPTRYAHVNPCGRYRLALAPGAGDREPRSPRTVKPEVTRLRPLYRERLTSLVLVPLWLVR